MELHCEVPAADRLAVMRSRGERVEVELQKETKATLLRGVREKEEVVSYPICWEVGSEHAAMRAEVSDGEPTWCAQWKAS